MDTATSTTAIAAAPGIAPPPPSPRLGEVRYSLPELLHELQVERTSGSFSQEKLHQEEISKLFKNRTKYRGDPLA
ncbi:MAG: hypothetical protein H2172_05170 [Opitutus sp.]|nr:hypothetical protein [Opitutus sp.]MCS6247858.1 hypothetical protein [Opitutus sp.]MCS6274161.1 hypothetical protein [Opitutus sp.]MCS6278935.1 hypothetical protein [Opitutus sp.]MCS6298685.1 hypothetical protein [Opitutus sp.]